MDVKTQQSVESSPQTALLRGVQDLIGRSEKDVLWLLYRLRPQHSGGVKLSANEVAKLLNLGASTVRRAYRRLEQIGFVAVTRNIGKRGIEGSSYTIQWNELEIAIDAGRVVEMTDERMLAARDAAGRFQRSIDGQDALLIQASDEQLALFGTKDEGSVKLTEPVRSNRPNRYGQIDRTGTVKLTEPSISCSSSNTPVPTPPPAASQPTIFDVGWLVVVDELKIFGCWETAIQKTLAIARQKGITSQHVSGLIRWAAAKVIALDADGRPLEQWRMPPDDELDTAGVPHGRLYLWGPPMLLWRIEQAGPHSGIADGWPMNRDRKAAYENAQRTLAARQSPSTPSGRRSAQQESEAAERQAKAEALRVEAETLEAAHGAAVEALSRSEAIALLPSFLRGNYAESKADPRTDRMLRLQILRAFAANVAVTAQSEESSALGVANA